VSFRFSLTHFCHQFLTSKTFPAGVSLDMTVGKGKDLAFLAKLTHVKPSALMAIDVQPDALVQAKAYLLQEIGHEAEQIEWRLGSHALIDAWLRQWPLAKDGVSLAMYNLGYLPGSDKKLTTMADSTLSSLEALMPWIIPGGGISLMVYPGHENGRFESQALQFWLQGILAQDWHLWQTARLGAEHAPYWVWMQKNS
jgi:hypothetical protein